MELFFNKLLRYPVTMLLPPGYMSIDSYKRVLKTKSSLLSSLTIETLMERDVIIVGSADTVREKLAACHADVGLGYFLGMFQIGSMPHDMTVASMERFAKDVMPAAMALEGDGRWEPDMAAVPTQAAE